MQFNYIKMTCLMFLIFSSKAIYLSEGCLVDIWYYTDQDNVKYGTYTQDGINFEKLEKNIRALYKGVDIPKIMIAESINVALTNKPISIGACYSSFFNTIVLRKDTIRSFNSLECEWVILHEAGHAQHAIQHKCMELILFSIPFVVCYDWGNHKSESYANFITKCISKAIAATVATVVIGSVLIKSEEKRADAWANKHARLEALQGGITALQYCKKIIQKEIKNYDSSLINKLSFPVQEWLLCPYHPSVNSRIANIKHAMKARFGVVA